MRKVIYPIGLLSLSLVLTLGMTGCKKDEATTKASTASDANKEMVSAFSAYQSDSKKLDGSSFGVISDDMAAKKEKLNDEYLAKLDKIPRDKLSNDNKIYYDTFIFDRKIDERGYKLPNQRFGSYAIPISHFEDQIFDNATKAGKKAKSLKDYHAQLNTLKDYTTWVDDVLKQYKKGQSENIELPKVLVKKLLAHIDANILPDDYAILRQGYEDLSKNYKDAKPEFLNSYKEATASAVNATKALVAYLGADYLAAARGKGDATDKNIGFGALKDGKTWYQWQLDRNSTTGKSAKELHALGQELVASAKSEMERVARFVAQKHDNKLSGLYRGADNKVSEREFHVIDNKGNVNLPEFFAYLNSEKFYYGRDGKKASGEMYKKQCSKVSDVNACELALKDYNKFKHDANKTLVTYFKPIKTDYTIVPTPAGGEKFDGVASYDNNEFNLNTNPFYSLQKWNVSTLLLHEAAPGHHFQNAYSIEYPAKDKPPYMKDVNYTAYEEGWALYTEWLGIQMGIYGALDDKGKPTFKDGKGMCKSDTDYKTFQGGIYKDESECNALQYFGSLNEAQLRNMRLAVDTGIHNLGWSLNTARDFMHKNSALGKGDVESETLRYAAYVGQAVSYKSGFLVIQSLLKKAQKELGSKFSWADFHDQLLKYGSLPMSVIESHMNAWIAAQKKAA